MEASAKQKVKILIVGGGGREHALAWKLSQSDRVAKIFVTPGNGGTHLAGGPIENVSSEVLGGSSITHIAEFAKRAGVHVVVVGPEAPLAEGLGDELQKNGIPCFGPTKAAAQIESSKAFAKDFMVRHSIPTARYETFDQLDKALHYIDTTEHLVVVKASGLAAGKGVVVPTSKEEAKQAVDEILGSKCFGSAGDQVVLEELLTGLEVSCLAFSDGNSVATMPLAQDHKRVNDGDEGPNTGGMGAFAPVPASILSRFKRYTSSGSSSIEEEYARLQEELKQTVIQTCVKGMKQEGIPFVGVLFAGIMLTEEGPKVLEYNCRLGDPETEALLPLLKTDLVDIIMACVEGTLDRVNVEWHTDKSAVAVIAASGGYPGKYATGKVIKGLDSEEASDVVVFHAGTSLAAGGKVVTSGGRVLAVTAIGDSLQSAVKKAYERIDQGIRFEGMHYRKDIARKAFQTFGQKKTRLAVLGSTRGTVMQAIIDAIKGQELDAEISVVVSNKKDAYILQRAKEHDLKHVYLPAKKGASREEYDRQVTAVLEENNADLVLLIGYMRILSGEFVRKYQGRLYNVHPSLLPLFAGGMDMDVHKAVIDAKCSESGCTVHHVTEEVDAGPIIMQKRCPVTADETPETLKAKVQQLEGVAMLEAIKLFQQQEQQQLHSPHEKITYGTAGVNIDAGDRFVEKIKPMAKSTSRPGADVELGGFGGLFDLKRAGFTDPILVSGTDGVGTKLKLAQQLGIHNTVGIDLVAMCVNDVLVQGAEPLFFLDYYATGALNVEEASEVVSGIAAGCKESGCALIGGETAEMPGMYSSGEYDLAGFAVGAVERDAILPRIGDVKIGDIVIGLSSSGVHSNGYSLVRHLINKHKDSIDLNGPPPFDNPPGNIKHERLANALLAPTKLYVKPLLPLMKKGLIKAAAHITGGGLLDNVPRVLPEDKAVELDMLKWTVPGIYSWLSQLGGGIEVREMLRTFNMGIGMVLIVENDEKTLAAVRESLAETGEEALLIGSVVPLDSSKEGQVYMQHTESFH